MIGLEVTGPVRPHHAAPAHRDAARSDGIVSFLTVEMILVVVTQKLAIPLGGSNQIALVFVIHYAALATLAARGRLLVSRGRLALFCLFAAAASLTQLGYSAETTSLPSLALMLLTAAMFIFVVPLSRSAYRELLRRFVLLAVAASALVGLDWALQAAHLPMPNLEALIPFPFVYQTYNYIQPVTWGSPWMKPNGVFFLETSHVSQFIALGLVVEITLFRTTGRIAALLLGLGATLGGTGMVLLVACLPLLLLRLPARVLVVGMALAPLLLVAAAQGGLLAPLTKRTAEFSQNSSSGFNRFVLPMQWWLATLDGPADQAWLGRGAGSMPKTINDEEEGTAGYAWPPYTKVEVEYGLVTLCAWLAYVLASIFGSGAPAAVAFAAFVQFEFLNGSLNVPVHTVYCLFLCAGYRLTREGFRGRSTPRVPFPRGAARAVAIAKTDNLY